MIWVNPQWACLAASLYTQRERTAIDRPQELTKQELWCAIRLERAQGDQKWPHQCPLIAQAKATFRLSQRITSYRVYFHMIYVI
jgi:hypothetical protein